jgi:hypothetical protein
VKNYTLKKLDLLFNAETLLELKVKILLFPTFKRLKSLTLKALRFIDKDMTTWFA